MNLGKVWIILPIILLCSCAAQIEDYPSPTNIAETTNPEPGSTKQVHSATPTHETMQNEAESPDQKNWIEIARQDLAEQLSIQPGAVELVSFEFVTWEDASLGCPQPGMVYIQLPIEGYRIQFSHDEEIYTYHGEMDNDPIRCNEPKTDQDLPASLSNQAGQDEAIQLAKQDLTSRLNIAMDQISVLAVVQQQFTNQSFTCQTSKERVQRDEPLQVIQGRSIILNALGDRYEYHASDAQVIFCRRL